jgi:hypothetical protein
MNFFECSTAETEIQKIYFLFKNYKMKTLLKISLVFVFALFVSMSVKGQGSPTATGTITVNVPAFMILTVTDIPNFVKPHTANSGVTAVNQQTNIASVLSNVKWSLSIVANDANLTGKTNSSSDLIPIGAFKLTSALDNGANNKVSSILTTSAIDNTITGTKDSNGNITWNFTPPTVNLFSDNYQVGLSYTLAQTAW